MTKRALAVLIAVVVAVGAGAAVIASSIGGSDAPPTHTMDDGKTMDGSQMTP